MEDQLFIYDELDVIDAGVFQYIGCTLAVDVGPYGAGQYVPMIELDLEQGHITLYNEYGVTLHSRQLILTIGDMV